MNQHMNLVSDEACRSETKNTISYVNIYCVGPILFSVISEKELTMANRNDSKAVPTLLQNTDDPEGKEETGDNNRIVCLLGGDVNVDQRQRHLLLDVEIWTFQTHALTCMKCRKLCKFSAL